jgi:hypothetical protein
MIYLIGSLRNPRIPEIANAIEAGTGHEVFSDWFCAGEIADDRWRDHSKARGRTYLEALDGYAARHVFEFDQFHLNRADAVVLAAPAGKSGHLELGVALGMKKPGYYLLEPDNERWDVMLRFATKVVQSVDELNKEINSLCFLKPCRPSAGESAGSWLSGLRDYFRY